MDKGLRVIDAHVHMVDRFIPLSQMLSQFRDALRESGFDAVCLVSDPSGGIGHLHKNLLCMLYKELFPEDGIYFLQDWTIISRA